MTVLARVQQGQERPRIGVILEDDVHLTTFANVLEWYRSTGDSWSGATLDWKRLHHNGLSEYRLLAPIAPPEVWACGFTYQRGPQFSASPEIPKGPAYTHAMRAGRPEIFFKTTSWRVVGPNDSVGIRADARYTAVEPEICLILDDEATPILYTVGNDVSAWDIEARNPLWLAQGKTYEACCALGPVAVTPDELPSDALIRCRVLREGETLFEGSVEVSSMLWSFEELASFAAAFNPLPAGTVLMTGTGIVRPDSQSLTEGDVVEISVDGIGLLRNGATLLTSPVPYMPYE